MRTHNIQTRNHGLASLSGLVVLFLLLGLTGAARADVQQTPAKDFDYGTVNLRVGVWIDGLEEDGVLERGQEMSVGFQTNADAYAVVYRIDTEGEVNILWPRSRMDDGFVFGGHEYMLPTAGARRLSASSRSGEGYIEVLTSRYPFDLRDLEVDFHHEYKAEKYHFQVLGDPFLAMNEINYAITRLEDTEDYVVSNYLSYYVHEKVDHPRYLCNQCHFDDDVTVNPYQDECTINITFDYGWSNRWYHDYGYFPVYYNPVYVYYDPWTWRPWVNFWYDPWYRCVSYPGWNWRNPVYVWCDSPYYRDYSDYRFGNVRRKQGRGLFTPDSSLKRRTKTSEFRDVSRIVAERGPSESQRKTMVNKERTYRSDVPGGSGAALVGRGGSDARVGGGSSAPAIVRSGEAPAARTRPQISERSASSSRGSGGLQIRRPSTRSGGSDGNTRVGTTPVNRGSRTIDRSGSSVDNTSRGQGDRRIQPVEPRRQSTRIWNSNRSTRSESRSSESGSSGTVRSGKSRSSDNNSSSGSSRVTPTRKNSSSNVKSNRNSGSSSSNSRSNSGSSSNVKSRSSSGSSSSRSSGGSSSRSSSGGSSRSSGGSSRTRSGR